MTPNQNLGVELLQEEPTNELTTTTTVPNTLRIKKPQERHSKVIIPPNLHKIQYKKKAAAKKYEIVIEKKEGKIIIIKQGREREKEAQQNKKKRKSTK